LSAVADSERLLRLSDCKINASMQMPQCYGATEAECTIVPWACDRGNTEQANKPGRLPLPV
jgi:hypothetical protein